MEEIKEKRCTKCGEKHPETKEYFYFNSHYNRFRSECIKCFRNSSSESSKKQSEANKKIREEKRKEKEEYEKKNGRECNVCKERFPLTLEYFRKNKNYKDGIDRTCKTCARKREKERYVKVGAEIKNPVQALDEKDKKDEEAFDRLMNAPKDKGIGDKIQTVKLKEGKQYKAVKKRDDRDKIGHSFTGVMESETELHITLRHKFGYCGTFLKADILTGEYKIKEVSQ